MKTLLIPSIVILILLQSSHVWGFSSLGGSNKNVCRTFTQSRFMGRTMTLVPKTSYHHHHHHHNRIHRKGSQMNMFLGTDSGILGVGAPEIATIVLVGYFVLGPSELYKLTKEIGKFFQNIRTLSSEASKSFESSMEDQLDLQELRKAQVELNQAFNFRRSINVDETAEAFTELPKIAEDSVSAAAAASTAATATATVTSSNKPKKRKRIKKKRVVDDTDTMMDDINGNIPDLDMNSEFDKEFKTQMGIMKDDESTETKQKQRQQQTEEEEEARAKVRAERMERLKAAGQGTTDSDTELAAQALQISSIDNEQQASAESARFASQLSADEWNKRIMENEDKLSPLSQIMQRLAILEEERLAANQRLDEEFQRRADIEDMYYQEKRKVLEEAAAEISADVYDGDVNRATATGISSN